MITPGSVYALAEEFRRGYITLQGGHRVGLAGRVIVEDGHKDEIEGVNLEINGVSSGKERVVHDEAQRFISSEYGVPQKRIYITFKEV